MIDRDGRFSRRRRRTHRGRIRPRRRRLQHDAAFLLVKVPVLGRSRFRHHVTRQVAQNIRDFRIRRVVVIRGRFFILLLFDQRAFSRGENLSRGRRRGRGRRRPRLVAARDRGHRGRPQVVFGARRSDSLFTYIKKADFINGKDKKSFFFHDSFFRDFVLRGSR